MVPSIMPSVAIAANPTASQMLAQTWYSLVMFAVALLVFWTSDILEWPAVQWWAFLGHKKKGVPQGASLVPIDHHHPEGNILLAASRPLDQ